MARRLILGLLVAGLLSSGAVAHGGCGGNGIAVTTQNSGTLDFGTISITYYENQANDLCAGAAPVQNPPTARLIVKQGNAVICDRTAVDPSFDPFFFGAGIHDPKTGANRPSCGVDFTVVGITVPRPGDARVDSAGRYAEGGLMKDVVTETNEWSYWTPGGTFPIPQGAAGTVSRGARLSQA